MQKEDFAWQKRMLVMRPIPGMLRPGAVVLSIASSMAYHHLGRQRQREQHSAVFQYTLSGCGTFEVAGCRHELPAGLGFCCYVGDPRIAYYYPGDAEEPWRFLYITWHDPVGITRALNEACGFVFNIDRQEPQIRRLLDYGRLPEMTVEVSAGAGHLFVNAILAMLADEARAQRPGGSAQVGLVRRAMRSIEANLTHPFNAALLADELGVSQEHLTRICRAELGQTPYQCICENKMHRACELLKNTNRTIAQVAVALGYEPGSHFARLFKRVVGVTPTAFREGASMPFKPF